MVGAAADGAVPVVLSLKPVPARGIEALVNAGGLPVAQSNVLVTRLETQALNATGLAARFGANVTVPGLAAAAANPSPAALAAAAAASSGSG